MRTRNTQTKNRFLANKLKCDLYRFGDFNYAAIKRENENPEWFVKRRSSRRKYGQTQTVKFVYYVHTFINQNGGND